MMHSFGDIAHPQIETANLLESLASIYLKHTMDQLVPIIPLLFCSNTYALGSRDIEKTYSQKQTKEIT